MGIYIDRPANTAKVCVKALEAGIEEDYVRELIRERNLILNNRPGIWKTGHGPE